MYIIRKLLGKSYICFWHYLYSTLSQKLLFGQPYLLHIRYSEGILRLDATLLW